MSRTALVAFCGLLLSVSAFSCDITLTASVFGALAWYRPGPLADPRPA